MDYHIAMNKYIFIIGQSSQLAQSELQAVLSSKNDQIELLEPNFVLAQTKQTSSELINILGGTIKIARYIQDIDKLADLDSKLWYEILSPNLQLDHKNYFGFSLYNDDNKNYNTLKITALKLKKTLKENNYKSRLVTSQEAELSSVIVAKNKLIGNELLIIKHNNKYILAITEAVQDFEAYGLRDMERPYRDSKSGMLPPKVAQMMINLSGKDIDRSILDPFCGSGTVLQEAMLLGYKKIYGSDISAKAVAETKANLDWLSEKFDIKANISITESDIVNIDKTFEANTIDLIVTEPFMGDARLIARQNKTSDLTDIKNELQILYNRAFEKFQKILAPQAIIIFVFPIFHIDNSDIYTLDKKMISQIGFKYLLDEDIIYSRPDQKVARQITVWQKNKYH